MAKQHDDNEVLSTSAQPDETPPPRPWHRPQIRVASVVDESVTGYSFGAGNDGIEGFGPS